jgi:hypothetical protein
MNEGRALWLLQIFENEIEMLMEYFGDLAGFEQAGFGHRPLVLS